MRRRAWGLRLALSTLVGTTLLVGLGITAWAHPLGNFTVNRYSRVEIGTEEIRVRYVLDLAEIPTLQELSAASLASDAPIDAVRARLLAAKTRELVGGARLVIEGRSVALSARDATLDLPEGQAGLRTMRIGLWLVAAQRIADGARVEYRDTNYAGRVGWQEIVITGIGGVVPAQSTVPDRDVTNELQTYPTDARTPPLSVGEASAVARLGLSTSAGDPVAVSDGTSRNAIESGVELLTGFLRGGTPDLAAVLVALGIAAMLGALHALGPGHGKTIVAAYLVGSRGTPAHAVLLGATVTATHTIGVYALGLVTLVAAQYLLPDRLYAFIGILSGLLVTAVGVGLARSRVRQLARPAPAVAGHGSEPHVHDAAHTHDHGHDHVPGASGEPVTLRSLLALGVSGGLLPCPSALVVLLAAVSFHNIALGLLLVAAFSVGLAAVLTGVGLMLVLSRRWLDRSRRFASLGTHRILRFAPILSAVAIATGGLVIAVSAARTL